MIQSDIARRLEQLGCTAQQVERHMARATAPPPIMRSPPSPKPLDWISWASRIRQNADNARRRAAARRLATSPHIT
jgi:hypothetical protein